MKRRQSMAIQRFSVSQQLKKESVMYAHKWQDIDGKISERSSSEESVPVPQERAITRPSAAVPLVAVESQSQSLTTESVRDATDEEIDRAGLETLKTSIRRYDVLCCVLGVVSMILSPIQVISRYKPCSLRSSFSEMGALSMFTHHWTPLSGSCSPSSVSS